MPFMRTATIALKAAFYVLLASTQSWAQIQIGTVTGAVTDGTSAALPGTVVTLENPVTGYRNQATTDDRGDPREQDGGSSLVQQAVYAAAGREPSSGRLRAGPEALAL